MSDLWVINVSDFGLSPRLIDAGLSAQGTLLTDGFNAALQAGLAQVGLGDLPLFDVAGLLREVVSDLLTDNGLRGAFGAQQKGNTLNITLQNFLQPTKLTYNLTSKQLRAEKKKFAWIEVLQRLHFRAGYNGTGALANVWPVIVDVFCITMLVWILTGLYLWWKIRVSRTLGWLTLGGGVATIALLLLTL